MTTRAGKLSILLFSLVSGAAIAEPATAESDQQAASLTNENESFFAQFVDPNDGMLDMSRWLVNNAYGFLPVPIIITEPAVDNGLGAAGVFFHKPKKDDREPEKGKFLLTDITAVAAAYTGNDSWLAGGGHFNTWRQDTRRYSGVIGYADVNLDFYGGEDDLPAGQQKVGFNAKGFFIDQLVEFRLGTSDWFVGGDWRYLQTDVSLKLDLPGDLPGLGSNVTVSGLGLVGHYENVDSRMSPSQGFSARFNAMWNDRAIGSDFEYNELKWQVRQYLKFAGKFGLAWRFDGATTDGDVPFFLQPFVQIEGIPALRYQGPTAATLEVRGGWEFRPRWSAIAFVGGGRAADDFAGLGSASSRTAVGAGFRYLLAKVLGLRVGLDVARGPEETYVYLVAGSAWSTGF